MNFLDGVRLRQKIISLLMLGVVSLLGFGIYFLATLSDQRYFLDRVNSEELPRSQTIFDNFSELSAVHARVFELLSAAGVNIGEETVFEDGYEISQDLQEIMERFSGDRDLYRRTSEEVKVVETLTEELDAYLSAVISAIEMVTVDVALAKREMAVANESYTRMNSAFLSLIRLVNGGISVSIGHLLTESDRRIVMVAVLIVLGLGAAGVFGFMTYSSISRNLKSITDVMFRLAEGDKQVEVVALERRDEIGAMARTLQIFKDAMIKAENLTAEREKEQKAKQNRAESIERLAEAFDQAAQDRAVAQQHTGVAQYAYHRLHAVQV